MKREKTITRSLAIAMATAVLLFTAAGCAESGNVKTDGSVPSLEAGNGNVQNPNDGVGNVSDGAQEEQTEQAEPKKEVAERVDMTGMAATANEDFVYQIAFDAVTITDYIGDSDIVIVPDTIEGYPVVVLKMSGESGAPRTNIRAIQIPASVTYVYLSYSENLTTVEFLSGGDYTSSDFDFTYCPDLTYINIPDGVKQMGGYNGFCLEQCSSLLNVDLPSSVTTIYSSAFFGCSSLTEMILPDSVTGEIHDAAFADCSSLQKVTLPEGIWKIGQKAFAGCESLKSIDIPQSCTVIDRLAFKSCTGLESVTIPPNVETVGQDAFNNTLLKEVIIEDGETELTLVSGCFASYELSHAVVPARVTEIDDKAFPDYSSRKERQNDYLVIECPAGSTAETFAKEKGYTVKN